MSGTMWGERGNMTAIVVLNDGETWTTIDGCTIMLIPEKQMKEYDAGNIQDARDFQPALEISLTCPWRQMTPHSDNSNTADVFADPPSTEDSDNSTTQVQWTDRRLSDDDTTQGEL